ncbi:MAG: hypothetical protein ACHQC9_01495 [Alphaproteobacteria bacterium]
MAASLAAESGRTIRSANPVGSSLTNCGDDLLDHAIGKVFLLRVARPKAGDRVRITGQLIDAVTGAHLWADRFDGSMADVFDLQDKVASSAAIRAGYSAKTAEVQSCRSTLRVEGFL